MTRKILVVAGEASADLHAGHVFEELRKTRDFQLFGIGGESLVRLGLDPVAHAQEMAVVGITEAISRIPRSLELIRNLEARAIRERPDFAFLVDLPDFNLRLAARLKRAGVPVVYFVSPQVWAWRSRRVHAMAKTIDRLLCILPFEKQWYREHAPKELRVEYVGHPAVEEIPALPYQPNENLVAILPGSRLRELESLLPIILEAAEVLGKERSELSFEMPLASLLRANPKARAFLDREKGPLAGSFQRLGNRFRLLEEPAHQVLRRAKLAFVASGTATLETAVVGTPMVVVYKVSRMSAFIFRNFVNYSGPVAMANILHVGLGSPKRIVPELLQDEANAINLSREALRLLRDPIEWKEQARVLSTTRALLSAGIASPTQKVIEELGAFLLPKDER